MTVSSYSRDKSHRVSYLSNTHTLSKLPTNANTHTVELSKRVFKQVTQLNKQAERKWSLRTMGSIDGSRFYTTSVEEAERERENRRRRRGCGAYYYSPWCWCCCCLATVLMLTGIAAGILALTMKSSQNKQSEELSSAYSTGTTTSTSTSTTASSTSTSTSSTTSTSTSTTTSTKTTSTSSTTSTDTTNTPVPVHSYNGSCLNDSYCNGTELLTCQNNTCVCSGNTTNGNWFWGGKSCLICPGDWMIFGAHCYYLSNTTKTWNDSRSYCQSYAADLLVIQSLAEYNFITDIGQKLMPTTSSVEAWIGLVTIVASSPGLFQWLDGTNITGLNPPNYIWCQWPYWWPEPDYQTRQSSGKTIYQMCGGLVHASNQSWPTNYIYVDDSYCDDPQLFICEKTG